MKKHLFTFLLGLSIPTMVHASGMVRGEDIMNLCLSDDDQDIYVCMMTIQTALDGYATGVLEGAKEEYFRAEKISEKIGQTDVDVSRIKSGLTAALNDHYQEGNLDPYCKNPPVSGNHKYMAVREYWQENRGTILERDTYIVPSTIIMDALKKAYPKGDSCK